MIVQAAASEPRPSSTPKARRRTGTCSHCGETRAMTATGLIYSHGSLRAGCPGAGKVPAEVTVQAFREILDDLPVFALNGAPVVRLDDLNDAVARAAAGIRPLDGDSDG
ncbi:hypothetical protein E1287_07205 [Actinomadura sp. KC06]|uniref:hypothetical protein n=1 Tax=Actinomadura sp. KC06 TaxID=2530369 RepID=UPI0010432701|nr:hypothetical protein [Actinomadura sp. KC06]TDD37839.1 hypothetical protein E1287_07205 [Actinomadura sp. KC06]